MGALSLAVLESAAGWLNRLPMVVWDRFVETDFGENDPGLIVYGWIARGDGRADFVVMEIPLDGRTPGFTTSSATYSDEIHELLHPDDEGLDVSEHNHCQRVEEVFGDLVLAKVELGLEEGEHELGGEG